MFISFQQLTHLFENLSFSQIINFLLIDLLYGINGVIYSCIPIVLYRPRFQCYSEQKQTLIFCSEEEACQTHSYRLFIEENPNIYSLSMELNLFCERKILEAILISVQFTSFIVSFIWQVLFPSQIEKVHKKITTITIITGMLLFSLQFQITYPYLCFVFFVWGFLRSQFYILAFVYIKSGFNNNIVTLGPALYQLTYTISQIAYTCFTYYFGHWINSLSILLGLSHLLFGFLFLLFQQYKNINEMASQINQGESNNQNYEEQLTIDDQMERLKTFYKNPIYFRNGIIAIGCDIVSCITWAGCVLSMNTLSGSLYTNLLLSYFIDLFFNCMTFFLMSYDLKQVIRKVFLIVGILLLIGIFNPPIRDIGIGENQNWVLQLLQALPIILAKSTLEINWSIVYIVLGKSIPIYLYQTILSLSCLMDTIFMDIQPFYKYVMEKFSLNLFIGYGLLSLLLSYFVMQINYIDAKDQEANNNNNYLKQMEFQDNEKEEDDDDKHINL